MMGCVPSRGVSSSERKLRLNESGNSDDNTRSVVGVNQMGGRDACPSEDDIKVSMLMSRGQTDQSNQGRSRGESSQVSEFTAPKREEISRDHGTSLKRKLEPEDGLLSLASLENVNSTRGELHKSNIKRNQLTAFILHLIQRRKRRLGSRVEVGDFNPATSLLTGNLEHREQDRDVEQLITLQGEPSELTMDDAKHHQGQIDTSRLSSHSSHSNPLQHSASIKGDPILLFTSVHQLCHEIINRKLLSQTRHKLKTSPKSPLMSSLKRMQNDNRHHNDNNCDPYQILCLFTFGLQGSSMGELSFELVQHSSLINFIQSSTHERETQPIASDEEQLKEVKKLETQNHKSLEHDCPLYHYIDVSALIVANIDQRIAVYNRLVGQALHSRRNQLARTNLENHGDLEQEAKYSEQGEQSPIGESDSSGSDSQEETREDDNDDLQARHELDTDSASLWSTREPSIASEISVKLRSFSPSRDKRPASASQDLDYRCLRHNQASHIDQFGMVTLSTRQRSILQLKLVKYATCVTAKWITILIHNEISRFERQLHGFASSKLHDKLLKVPPRVYLINLVPNQLSLFKTCLYLQQELALNNFRHQFSAIKFERRTNIRVLTKEQSSDQSNLEQTGESEGDRNGQHQSRKENNNSQRLLHRIKLSQIRLLPAYLITRSHSEPNVCEARTGDWKKVLRVNDLKKTGEHQQRSRQIEATASNLFANSTNQKLGPRVSENFVTQFSSINKLVRVRYNPTANYNYASTGDTSRNQSEVKRLNSDTKAQDVCYQKLRRELIEGCKNEEQSKILTASRPESPILPQSPMTYRPPPVLSVAIDDSARSQSVSLDLQSNKPYDENNLRPDQDQVDFGCLAPPPASPTSIFSNGSSELSGYVSVGCRSPRLSMASTSVSAGTPKWAVELELKDAHDAIDNNKWYSRSLPTTSEASPASVSSSESQATDSRCEAPETFSINCYLHVYMPPTRRSSSRSPLSLVSTSNGRANPRGNKRAASHHAGHYYLVHTPVAYANDHIQPILEAKTFHKRTIRYSSGRSSSSRLLKLLARAQNQLVTDLDSWLRDSLEHFKPHVSADENQDRRYTNQHHRMAVNTIPSLVTYTIKVDVTKMLKRLSKPSDHETNSKRLIATTDHLTHRGLEPVQLSPDDLAHLLQMKPERPTLSNRPASALTINFNRDQSHTSSCILRSKPALQASTLTGAAHTESDGRYSAGDLAVSKPRHVQFKLNKAPEHGECDAENSRAYVHCQGQTRVWVKECLFVSCHNRKLIPMIDHFIRELFAKSEMK